MPVPIELDETTYVFRNPEGNPITTQWWPRKSWYPMLRRIKIRVRKFYATRHTFITDLISRGEDMKAVAEYCGTSVAMIERSYGRWMPRGVDRGIRSLRSLLGNHPDRNLSGTFVRRAVGDGLTHDTSTGKENGPTGNRTSAAKRTPSLPNRSKSHRNHPVPQRPRMIRCPAKNGRNR